MSYVDLGYTLCSVFIYTAQELCEQGGGGPGFSFFIPLFPSP